MAAILGVIVILGAVWWMTRPAAEGNGAATTPAIALPSDRGEEPDAETTTSTAPESTTVLSTPPTTASGVATTTATTSGTQAEADAYALALEGLVSEGRDIVDRVVDVNVTWDANEGRLSASARGDLYRTTESALIIAVRDLRLLVNDVRNVAAPSAALALHGEVEQAAQSMLDEGELVLEGLRLPRGSETVDGAVRRAALEDLQDSWVRLSEAAAAASSAALTATG